VSEFTSAVRVGIIDHVPLFGIGIAQVLSEASGVAFAGSLDSAVELVRAVSDKVVDLVLIDSAHPAGCSQLCEQAIRADAGIHILVVVSNDDDAELSGAVRAGVRGYIRRDCQPHELLEAIRSVSAGASLISPAVASRLLDELALATRRNDVLGEGAGTLSRRELDVLRLIAQGLNNKAIAASLYISENTVKNHVRSIHEKLQVHSRMEAVVRAVREGLLQVG
jgi:two-component system NarL family response regulator